MTQESTYMDMYEERRKQERLEGAVIMREMSKDPAFLDACLVWRDDYRSIQYKIKFWGCGSMNEGKGMWNYYLLLKEQQFSVEEFAALWLPGNTHTRRSGLPFKTHDYYTEPFTELDFHGGITSYAQHENSPGFRCVEAGCDYGHAWDRDAGYQFDFKSVKQDVQHSIDLLWKLYPNILVCCCWDGSFHPKEEMIENKHGNLIWKENTEEKRAERK